MLRFACTICLVALALFVVSPALLADGVHHFNHAGSDLDVSISDSTHATLDHDHGNHKAWGHLKHKHGNDNDADDNDDNDGNSGNDLNTGGSNSGSGDLGVSGGSGDSTTSVPEPSASLLLVLGLSALFVGNFKNTLRKLCA